MNAIPSVRVPDWVLHGLLTFFQFLASAGVLLILYGVVSAFLQEPWLPLEKIAVPLSATLTLIGTAMTAASIYLYGVPSQPPAILSKWLLAPLVILSAATALYCVWTITISPVIVNGFSALGLAGALARIVPRPSFMHPTPN